MNKLNPEILTEAIVQKFRELKSKLKRFKILKFIKKAKKEDLTRVIVEKLCHSQELLTHHDFSKKYGFHSYLKIKKDYKSRQNSVLTDITILIIF